MTLSRLKKLILRLSLAAIGIISIHVLPGLLSAQIPPSKEILPMDNPAQPQWKLHWDMGRDAARQNDFPRAARLYSLVIKEKPQIEEARWEYARILGEIGRVDESLVVLDGLLETNPNRYDYLEFAGKTAIAAEEYNRAARYLERALTLVGDDAQRTRRIRQALSEALARIGREGEAFTLLEQVYAVEQPEPGDLLKLARMASDLGLRQKADGYYTALIGQAQVDGATLAEAARYFAENQNESRATKLWQKLVQDNPKNREYRQQLLSLYRGAESGSQALPHLLALLEDEGQSDPKLLLETAKIFQTGEKNPEKALSYYEKYLRLRPADIEAIRQTEALRASIAHKLQKTIDPKNVTRVWKEISTFTDYPSIIFRLLADSLSLQGDTKTLVEVLEVLYRQPGNKSDALALQLARLHAELGHDLKAYQYYDIASASGNATASTYQQQGFLAQKLGYDVDALLNFQKALSMQPASADIRQRCLELSGNLGLISDLRRFARPLLQEALSQDTFRLYLTYLNGLRVNRLYQESESLRALLLEQIWLENPSRNDLLLGRAEDLRRQGQLLAAQQQLRQIMAAKEGNIAGAVGQLMDISLESGSTQDALALYDFYKKRQTLLSQEQQGRAFLQIQIRYARLLELDGRTEEAVDVLQSLRQGLVHSDKAKQHVSDRSGTEVDLHLCRLYLTTGQKGKCLALIQQHESVGDVPVEIRLAKYVAAGTGAINPEALLANLPGRESRKGGVVDAFRLADAAMVFGQRSVALSFIEDVRQRHPESLRARMAGASLLDSLGKFPQANQEYTALYQENPTEIWLYVQYIRNQFKLGRYRDVLTELQQAGVKYRSPELFLLEARCRYALGEKSEAFSLYEQILKPPAKDQFVAAIQSRRLGLRLTEQDESSLRKWLGYGRPDQFSLLNSLQGDDGFLAHVDTPLGALAAEHFEDYSWQNIAETELKARTALEQRKYTVAEKTYSQGLDQSPSTESLKDLARIYERLGQYEKQAKMYTSIEQRGETTPEMQEAIERNRLALAPTIGLDFEYLEKEGRQEQVNLRKLTSGVSFQYLPGEKSKVRMAYSELLAEPATDGHGRLEGRIFQGEGSYAFNPKTRVDVGAGLQMLDSGSESKPFYSARLTNKFDNLLSGYLEANQHLVDDTIEAIDDGITRTSLLGGLMLESPSGISLGGELNQRWYKDDNEQNLLQLWTAYTIFDELTSYELRYGYIWLQSDEDDRRFTVDAGGTVVEEPLLPYWSPREYWQHQVRARVQRLIRDSADTRLPPSSCSLDLLVGYESDLDFTFGGGFDIFLEIGSNFLVKGSLFYTDNSDYNEQRAALSLSYRW